MDDYLLTRSEREREKTHTKEKRKEKMYQYFRAFNKNKTKLCRVTYIYIYICIYYLLRHVPVLYASIKQLEVAGKKVPSREVMCTAKELMTSHHFQKRAH